MIGEIKVGDVRDFRNFMGAVIDRKAFDGDLRLPRGGEGGARRCWPAAGPTGERATSSSPRSSRPTDPGYKLLCEEIFGPVVTAYVYDDARWEETLRLVDATSPYALTGAVFANDRAAVRQAAAALRDCGRQLLRQRQAHRGGGGPAAVRRRPRVGHERQGGLEAEPRPLGERPRGEGDLQPAARLPLPVHGRGVIAGRKWSRRATGAR